jgi:hypothetical protein
VNTGSSEGLSGGIDGNTLVYERIDGDSDDVWTVDLTTLIQAPVVGTVTSQGEYGPTISGDWILFGRGSVPRTRVLLYNRSSGETRELAFLNRAHSYVSPGQVNGDYAAWSRITRKSQTVYLYDIAARRSTRVAQPRGVYDYAPAVTAAGTLYFARGRSGCGKSVAIYKQPLAGKPQLVQRVRAGFDVTPMFASSETQLLYSAFSCRTNLNDLYSLTVTG